MKINNIVLIENIQLNEFNIIKGQIKELFGYDISYMKLIISNIPVYNNGKINTKMNPLQYGGCWTQNQIVQIANHNHLKKVMKYYNIENEMSVLNFSRHLMIHELSHEIYNNILTNDEKNNFKTKLKNFRTVYTDTVSSEKLDSEKFCEYIAVTLMKKYYL